MATASYPNTDRPTDLSPEMQRAIQEMVALEIRKHIAAEKVVSATSTVVIPKVSRAVRRTLALLMRASATIDR
jgi:hypothetical protein